jgi:hypothetical protein
MVINIVNNISKSGKGEDWIGEFGGVLELGESDIVIWMEQERS